MVNIAKWLVPALLATSASSVSAGVEYDDTYLHRSDEMVRFDRAYRTGLKDGTTTIIYTEEAEPKKVPDIGKKTIAGVSPDSTVAEVDQVPGEPSNAPSDEYQLSEWPDLDKDSHTNQGGKTASSGSDQKSPSTDFDDPYRNNGRANSGADSTDVECDCDNEQGRAPKSRPVTKSRVAQPDMGQSMEEQLEAVRKARELLRQSQGSNVAASSPSTEVDQGTPRIPAEDSSTPLAEAPLTPYELDPDYVRNQEVNVDIPAATIEEIAQRLMPRGWRVRLSTADADVHAAKYEFVSSDPREVALRNLLRGTGLGYKLFFDLKDEYGDPSPLLVISEINS